MTISTSFIFFNFGDSDVIFILILNWINIWTYSFQKNRSSLGRFQSQSHKLNQNIVGYVKKYKNIVSVMFIHDVRSRQGTIKTWLEAVTYSWNKAIKIGIVSLLLQCITFLYPVSGWGFMGDREWLIWEDGYRMFFDRKVYQSKCVLYFEILHASNQRL